MTAEVRFAPRRGVDHATARRRRVWRIVAYTLGLMVLLYCMSVWFSRSVTEQVELGEAVEIVVIVESGDVKINGDPKTVAGTAMVAQSWTWRAPVLETASDGVTALVRVRCPSSFPCRASVDIDVHSDTEVTVVAPGGNVLVSGIDAAVTVQAGEGVALGPLGGSARVVNPYGELIGAGLRLRELQVRAGHDRVDLDFSVAPDVVDIVATDAPVHVALPDQVTYLISVPEGGDVDPVFGSVSASGRKVVVDSAGNVTVGVHEPITME